MPEGQELLQAGGGLQAASRSTSAPGARGPGSSAARPVTTPIARAARCSTGSGIPLNAAACSASPSAAAICFLVALGIDYNIFLMTRVREETGKHGPRRGALTGLSATGGVITSAGAVLAGTFAALATLPVTFLAELGFAVAFGVLLDTIVVRSVLVTALNLDLGRWAWWPSKLAREPATAHKLSPHDRSPAWSDEHDRSPA